MQTFRLTLVNLCMNFANVILSSISRNADGSSSAYTSAGLINDNDIATFCNSPPLSPFMDLSYNFLIPKGEKTCSSTVVPSNGPLFAE